MPFTLELTDEQSAIQELVASLAKDVVDPAAREAEKAGAVPVGVSATLHSTGLVAPVSLEHGGDGVPDDLSRLVVAEGLAYGDPGIAVSALWSSVVAVVIGAVGTDEQRAGYLPAFARDAAHRGGLALFEGFGRAPSEFETTISRTDGGWRVRGRKLAVQTPSAGAPLLAVGRDADGTLRAVVLDPRADGVTLRSVGTHLGLDAIPTATVDLDLEVSDQQVLGGEAGDEELARQVSIARLCTAAAAVGAARRAVDYAAAYAKERVAFGRPISTFQGVAFLVAEGHMRVQAAWLQLRQTLELLSSDPDAERAVAHAVGYATTTASEVTRDCVQVLGGHGFLSDHPVELWYRATAGLATLDLDPTTQAFAPAL